MTIAWKESTWRQYAAAIDTLENAVDACPEELWQARLWDDPASEQFFLPQYWYIVYHTLFWIDLYLTGSEEGFTPPEPFLLVEQNDEGPLPEKPYTKEELTSYLQHCRQKCRTTIAETSDEAAMRRCTFGWGEVSYFELLLYTMRHVQEHAAQLSLFLGQQAGADSTGWVSGMNSS
jgi:hypothetical protein